MMTSCLPPSGNSGKLLPLCPHRSRPVGLPRRLCTPTRVTSPSELACPTPTKIVYVRLIKANNSQSSCCGVMSPSRGQPQCTMYHLHPRTAGTTNTGVPTGTSTYCPCPNLYYRSRELGLHPPPLRVGAAYQEHWGANRRCEDTRHGPTSTEDRAPTSTESWGDYRAKNLTPREGNKRNYVPESFLWFYPVRHCTSHI